MSLRLFGKSTAIYAIGNVGLKAASFLLVPLYAHSLSLKDYGLLATLLITIQIMLIFMNLGMRTSLIRFTQEYVDNEQIGVLLGTTMMVNILGGVCITGIMIFFLLPFLRAVLHTDDVGLLAILACTAALIQSLSLHIMSYYRARHRATKFMLVGISSASLLFITSFIALRIYHLGIIGALNAYILTHTIIFLYIAIEVFRKYRIRISPTLIPRLVRFGFPLVFSMVGGAVLVESSIYFLSYFYNLETVAVYSLGFKLSQLLAITVILPFQLAFQPYVFSNLGSPNISEQISRIFIYFLLAITFMSFMIILGSHIILPYIAPPEYAQAFGILLHLLPLTAFLGVHYFSETLLSAAEKTHIIGLTMTVCAILCLSLNYLLIPSLSWHGAVIASNVSFFIVALTLFLIGIRVLSIHIQWYSVSAITMLFSVFLLMTFLLNSLGQIAFYSGWALMFFTSLALLYHGPFFNKQERILFRNSAARLKSVISS